jgi:hypothetical protein
VIGFERLLVTNVPAVFELGAFSVLGVACCTLLSITAVPAALALLPLPAWSAQPGFLRRASRRIQAVFGALLRVFNHSSARYSRSVIAVWVCSPARSWVVPHAGRHGLSVLLRRRLPCGATSAVNRLLAGAVPIYVVIGGDSAGAMREPGPARWSASNAAWRSSRA